MASVALAWSGVSGLRAEDADRPRAYMHLKFGEFSPSWGVKDMRGISFGSNLNRYLGAELSFDAYQLDLADDLTGQDVSEQWIYALMPQVRLRYPLWHDRIVPYLLGGVGGAYVQTAEDYPAGFGHKIEGEGLAFAGSLGGGVDFFVADNIAFNLEGKYIFVGSRTVTIDGREQSFDPSAFTASLGMRVFFDENRPRPFVGAEEENRFPTRLYLGTQAGFDFQTDGTWVDGARLSPKPNAPFDTMNLMYNVSLGADFGEHLGAELMLSQTEYNLDISGLGPVGEYAIYAVIPELRLRFPSHDGAWVPYGIAGVGGSYGELNHGKEKAAGLGIHAKGFYPAFNAGLGVERFIARNVSLDLEGRWLYVWNHELEIPDGPSAEGDFGQFQVGVGVRLYLLELGKHEHGS